MSEVDDPPTLASAIQDISADEDDPSQTIDLSTVFSDIDSSLTHSIESNSNASLISASINQDTLTIEFIANQNGNADITIKAESNGQSISDTFNIEVNAINDPPSISAIDSQQVSDKGVTISYTIADIETTPENLSVTLLTSDANILPILSENVVMTGFNANRNLALTPVDGAYGSCMLTIVVMDDTSSASRSFAFENVRPTYTIVCLADGNGTISPSGPIAIQKGNNTTLLFEPLSGNQIDDILIDGNSVGPKFQYTFWSVAQDYTIKAIFSPIPAPIADFYAEPISGFAPLIVDFINTSQNEFSSIQWQFGDNSKSNATTPVHTYALPGQYTVCLQLNGPGGAHALTKTAYIQVNEGCDLNVQFSADQRTVPIQTDIQMTAIVSDSDTDLVWDFGDGTYSQQRNPVHAYSRPGLYDISLTATGTIQDCTSTTTKAEYIQVVGRRITGQIRANSNGVPDCLVSLWYNQTRMLAFALTDENGDYTFTSLPAISGLVMSVMPSAAMRNQYMMQYYLDATLWDDAQTISTLDQDLDLDMDLIEPPNNGICGQITNGLQGLADVQVSIYSESLDLARTVTSDDQGNYTITGLPLADDYLVSAYLSTINQEYYYALPQGLTPGESIPEISVTRYTRATPIAPDDPCVENINIIMQNAQIMGTVLSDSQPVSNVWVNAWSNKLHCSNGSTTNANGQYTITGLIAVSDTDAPTKGYIIELQSSGFPYQVFDNQTDIEQAIRVETGRQDINFQLFSDRQFTGRITDTNGHALSGTLIQIVSDETDTQAQTYSDENGDYTFTGLSVATDYIAYAYAESYPLQYYQNVASSDQAIEIDLFDDHAANIDFIMDKGALIQGQVTFLESDQPVGEGIWVNIWSESTQSGGDVPTDANGNYEITGLNSDTNDYIVSIWHQDYLDVFYSTTGLVYQYADATPIAPSDENRNLKLTTGFCITGETTYLNEPIAHIQIWAEGPTTAMTMSDLTSVNGANYEICGLTPGSYEINLLADQYLDDTYPTQVVIDNSNQTHIDFQLMLPTRILSGTIYQTDMDEIVTLSAWSQSKDCNEIIRVTATGSSVDFEFSNLKPGSDYRLEIRPDAHDDQIYNQKTWSDADLIDLSTNDVNGIEITLTRSDGEISGWVQFPNPLIENDAVWITAFSEILDHQKTIMVSPGNGGNIPYSITGLKLSTDYIVHLTADVYEQQYFSNATALAQAMNINTLDFDEDININFTLTAGGSISGQIKDATEQAISGANVMVWSDQLGMGASSETNNSGHYQVNGLNGASDYVVSVQDNTTTFYYHSDGTVVQASKKGYISLNPGENKTGVDMTLLEGTSIAGTIRNISGSTLANVYISVWSESLDSGGSSFSNAQGKYRIENLLPALDYTVEAIPDSGLGYINQVRNNVQSNTQQVDFILQQGYALTGQVGQWNQTPVPNVVIEISSISQNIFQRDTSDNQGYFEIQGLPSSTDYIIQATPPNNSNLSMFENRSFMIDDHSSIQITLASALSISGTIQVAESLPYTQNARINIYSENGFDQWTESDNMGHFELFHVPDATNYVVCVYADGYVDQSLYQIAAGENVNIVLSEAKQAFGDVKNARGQAIANARVEIDSTMMNLSKSTVTLSDGSFVIDGLPEYYNGTLVDDYSLRVIANDYPEAQKNNISLETPISIVLDADDSSFIGGSVTDIDGNPVPDGTSVSVRLYEQILSSNLVRMKTKQVLDENGTFMFTGLDANKTYKLKFKQLENNAAKEQEWAGDNNIGVEKRWDAIFYSVGETVVFRFSDVWH
ncbi:MAG: hypothetical protein OMM_03681 [Candidatus Magnetoglobus multicellularis str. Araruama]|uniref:PKD domain-containing protein n=1 Tax=Candidatus Magnetoglobus multicellularis str. Araruama TaxID=890399 RepID=A0A1V1P4U6_9BACT|nr:MAG: hypothetical protein OMM_03681 [Candidatus Magnetoglobus multicellularis str. Araruama]